MYDFTEKTDWQLSLYRIKLEELHACFEQFRLKIAAEANSNTVSVNFVDITFDLATGKHQLYRNPNDDRPM